MHFDVLSCLQPFSIRGLIASWTSLLHFLLSLVFFNRSSNRIPVHSSMLSILRILGFPCFLAPGVVPCIISFSRKSPSFLITCPKDYNGLLLILLSSPQYNTIQFRLLARLRKLGSQLTQTQLRPLHNTLEFGKLETST